MVKFKKFTIKKYDSLEPYFDKRTMKIHSEKHHEAYKNKLNDEIKRLKLKEDSIEKILSKKVLTPALKNNGGGYFNHNVFFSQLKKNVKPTKKILDLIEKNFKSFKTFKEKFSNSALSLFGSGWTWLIYINKKLKIVNTKNQENPLMNSTLRKGKILLGLDLWEHSYYLKFQNVRAKYVENFFNVIDWKVVEKRFSK